MSVPWDELEHAHGPADDLPELLTRVAKARGRKLDEAADDLCSRVLHQGSIYNASPRVAEWVREELPQAGAEHRRFYYGLLAGFADAARDACAGGCCGDPADGEALREVLISLQQRALADLANRDAGVRHGAAAVAGAFPGEAADLLLALRERYFAESEEHVRGVLLDALIRARQAVPEWPGFLRQALERETGAHNRLDLCCAQVLERSLAAGDEVLGALVDSLAAANQSGRFFEAMAALGERRSAEVMLAALRVVRDEEVLLSLAEQLLRQVFRDQRRGWGARSYSRLNTDGAAPESPGLPILALRAIGLLLVMKLTPGVRRWWLRRKAQQAEKQPGIRRIEIWGLSGLPPRLPVPLEPRQREVVEALAACDGLWSLQTNLWELFGLPAGRDALRQFARN